MNATGSAFWDESLTLAILEFEGTITHRVKFIDNRTLELNFTLDANCEGKTAVITFINPRYYLNFRG